MTFKLKLREDRPAFPSERLEMLKEISELKADKDQIVETLHHALEALAWYDAENFEMDGYKIGDRIRAVLINLNRSVGH